MQFQHWPRVILCTNPHRSSGWNSEAIRIFERMEEERKQKVQAKAEANKPKKVTLPPNSSSWTRSSLFASSGWSGRLRGAALPPVATGFARPCSRPPKIDALPPLRATNAFTPP